MIDIFHYSIMFVVLVLIELCYFRFADHFNIIDKPNERSSHHRIVLRGGGIIFWIGSLVYFVSSDFSYPWFFAGLTLISFISFVDDVHSVPNRYRLLVHFVAMMLMFFQWGIITSSNGWLIIPALILCTGIINAYNFMDGINGITGGYSLVIMGALAYINATAIQFVDPQLLMVTILALLVFCFFNYRTRAKCFAGDVGSVSIAFIILFALGKLVFATNDLSYIILLAVYGVDSILTIIHRLMLHENIFKAHRKHAYQLMANELKIPHVVVSLIYMTIQLLIAIGQIFLPINHWFYFCIVITVLVIVYILFMKKYFHLHLEYENRFCQDSTSPETISG